MILAIENYLAFGKVHDAVYHVMQSTDESLTSNYTFLHLPNKCTNKNCLMHKNFISEVIQFQ